MVKYGIIQNILLSIFSGKLSVIAFFLSFLISTGNRHGVAKLIIILKRNENGQVLSRNQNKEHEDI